MYLLKWVHLLGKESVELWAGEKLTASQSAQVWRRHSAENRELTVLRSGSEQATEGRRLFTVHSRVNLASLEEAVDVAHFHNHRLQLGVVLDCHLAVLSAKAWWSTAEIT